jgi:hypothetical protein
MRRMDTQALLPLFDRETRVLIDYPGMLKETLLDSAGAPRVVRFTRPPPGRSHVQYARLAPEAVEAEIDSQIGYFTANRLIWDWKVYAHDQPADLGQRLQARGFVPDDPGTVMALDIASAPETLLAPVSAPLRAITRREELVDVISVLSPVWGEDFSWVTERLGGHLAIPGYLEVYVAEAEDQPACAGWVYFPPGTQFASLWGGSTLSEFRGRGLYTAVLAARVQSAQRRGYRYLFIDASPMSQPIVARHGFEPLTTAQWWEWPVEKTTGEEQPATRGAAAAE